MAPQHEHEAVTIATTPSSTSSNGGSTSSEVDLLELDFFELQRRLCFQNETEESSASVEGKFDYKLYFVGGNTFTFQYLMILRQTGSVYCIAYCLLRIRA
jgi:hypothetical protein